MVNKYRNKLRKPRRVYEFSLEHPTWSHRKIANVFHVTRQRVNQIVQQYRNGAETPQD